MKILRLIFILAIVIALGAGLWWLAIQPGEISYTGGKIELSTSPAVAAGVLLLATLVLSLLWGIIGWFWALPNQLKKASLENNRKKAIESCGLSLAAFEGGDFSESRRQSQKALALLPDSPAAKLLHARTSLAADDIATAEKLMGELTQTSGFEIAARKGLAEIAKTRGNFAAAISHADAALQISKKAIWPVELIFQERINNADWEGAILALDEAEKRGLIGKKTAARRRAVVLTAAAHRAERNRNLTAALDYINRATKLASGFAPAAVMAARLNSMAGKDWPAASAIEQAWESEPHPALALAYKDLKAGKDKAEIAKWSEGLVKLNPNHRESKILRAEIAINKKSAEAVQLIEELLAQRATSRLLALRAQIALNAGDKAGYEDFMQKAAVAPREPDWSDLDPDGSAFAYEDEDWARMVTSYGDNGVLLHPRLEKLQPSRTIKPTSSDTPAILSPSQAKGEPLTQPDDPGYVKSDGEINPMKLLGR